MKLNKTWKIIIGLGTLWVALYPFILPFLMVLIMIPSIAITENNPDVPPFFLFGFFAFFFVMMFSAAIQMLATIFYFIHIIKNKNGLDILRIILGIGAFYMPFFALPIYYFIYVWPDTLPAWAMEKIE